MTTKAKVTAKTKKAATGERAARGTVTRDPARTRARLLRAATVEFAAKGHGGGRTRGISRRAGVNVRMIDHYFGGKDGLYIAVLEEVLARLRQEELQLDVEDVPPLEGLLRLFDFIDGHFARHPELRQLLAFENLNRARHLSRSERIPTMSSPVLGLIDRLLRRGVGEGLFRHGIDPLKVYVAMVSLSYYGKSHAHTLSRIFGTDLADAEWQRAQAVESRRMVAAYLLGTH